MALPYFRPLMAMAALAALLVSGCKGPCLELSERLCDCEPTTALKDQCKARASDEQSRVSPSEEDENRCEELLEVCDCARVGTREGKIQCGLARPTPVPE